MTRRILAALAAVALMSGGAFLAAKGLLGGWGSGAGYGGIVVFLAGCLLLTWDPKS